MTKELINLPEDELQAFITSLRDMSVFDHLDTAALPEDFELSVDGGSGIDYWSAATE